MMESKTNRPILVTGAHRSGTTWVGRMLALAPRLCYVHEPFHIRHDPGLCQVNFKYWFTYVTDENEQAYLEPVRDTFRLKYHTAQAVKSAKTLGQLRKVFKEDRRFASARRRNARALVKDPIAVFSAEWLAKRFNTQVVVLIRHPAAFVGSLKIKGWAHPFAHFLKQPLLIRDYLADYEGEIRRYTEMSPDIVDQGALLWRMIYRTIFRLKRKHPDWIFVRHKDLSAEPEMGFQRLYQQLGLTYNADIAKTVRFHSELSHKQAKGSRYQFDTIRRNSKKNIYLWKERLSDDEISRVRRRVDRTSAHFYSDDEW